MYKAPLSKKPRPRVGVRLYSAALDLLVLSFVASLCWLVPLWRANSEAPFIRIAIPAATAIIAAALLLHRSPEPSLRWLGVPLAQAIAAAWALTLLTLFSQARRTEVEVPMLLIAAKDSVLGPTMHNPIGTSRFAPPMILRNKPEFLFRDLSAAGLYKRYDLPLYHDFLELMLVRWFYESHIYNWELNAANFEGMGAFRGWGSGVRAGTTAVTLISSDAIDQQLIRNPIVRFGESVNPCKMRKGTLSANPQIRKIDLELAHACNKLMATMALPPGSQIAIDTRHAPGFDSPAQFVSTFKIRTPRTVLEVELDSLGMQEGIGDSSAAKRLLLSNGWSPEMAKAVRQIWLVVRFRTTVQPMLSLSPETARERKWHQRVIASFRDNYDWTRIREVLDRDALIAPSR